MVADAHHTVEHRVELLQQPVRQRLAVLNAPLESSGWGGRHHGGHGRRAAGEAWPSGCEHGRRQECTSRVEREQEQRHLFKWRFADLMASEVPRARLGHNSGHFGLSFQLPSFQARVGSWSAKSALRRQRGSIQRTTAIFLGLERWRGEENGRFSTFTPLHLSTSTSPSRR